MQVSGHIYHIYLGTFKSTQDVRSYKDEPFLRGKKIKVAPHKVSPRETWYRVEVGNYDTKEKALEAIEVLKNKKRLPLLDCLPK